MPISRKYSRKLQRKKRITGGGKSKKINSSINKSKSQRFNNPIGFDIVNSDDNKLIRQPTDKEKCVIALLKDYMNNTDISLIYINNHDNISLDNTDDRYNEAYEMMSHTTHPVTLMGTIEIDKGTQKIVSPARQVKKNKHADLLTKQSIDNAADNSVFLLKVIETEGDCHHGFCIKQDQNSVVLFDPSYPNGPYKNSIPSNYLTEYLDFNTVNYIDNIEFQKPEHFGDTFCQSWSLMYLKNPTLNPPQNSKQAAKMLGLFFTHFSDSMYKEIIDNYWTRHKIFPEKCQETNKLHNLHNEIYFDKSIESAKEFLDMVYYFPFGVIEYILTHVHY